MSDRNPWVGIPGRQVSIGGCTERDLALVMDDAERSYLDAADADHPGPWAAAVAYGNGILHSAAIFARITDVEAERLFTARCGALPAEVYGQQP